MAHRILDHLRSNVVAYLALFLAAGGTSYAAVAIPNSSIDPVKLNRAIIGGYVRAWASVAANGHVLGSGGRVGVRNAPLGASSGPYYYLSWRAKLDSRCTAIGSVDDGNGAAGYLTADLVASRRSQPTSIVHTYDQQGQPTALPFEVELLCATPR